MRSGNLRYTFGTNNTHQFLSNYGNTLELENGRFYFAIRQPDRNPLPPVRLT